MKNKDLIFCGIAILLWAITLSTLVRADVIIQEVNESSGIVLNNTLDIELRNATVNITFLNGEYNSRLVAIFEVYSNEDKPIKTKVYLKAKGQECYGWGCHSINVSEQTYFKINYPSEVGETEIYRTDDGEFASIDFVLLPKQINIIVVKQNIDLPFNYYLDSLLTFQKANHEKIVISGTNITAKFNNYYPVKLVSDKNGNQTWIWEYSNINTSDNNLKDILIIENGFDKNSANISFIEKIINWFKNLF